MACLGRGPTSLVLGGEQRPPREVKVQSAGCRGGDYAAGRDGEICEIMRKDAAKYGNDAAIMRSFGKTKKLEKFRTMKLKKLRILAAIIWDIKKGK